MLTADIKFFELCEEIDYWKSEAQKWENQYNEMVAKYNTLINDDIKHSQVMIGNLVKLALVSDEEKIKQVFWNKEE